MNKKINLKNILKENINLRNLLNDYKPKSNIQDIVIGVDETSFESKQFLYFLLNNYNRSMAFLDYSFNHKLITTHDYTQTLPDYENLDTIYIYQNKLANIKIENLIGGLLSILKIGGSIILEFTYTHNYITQIVINKYINLTKNYGALKYKENEDKYKNVRIYYENKEPKSNEDTVRKVIYMIQDCYKVDVVIIPPPLFATIKKSIWLKITKV